jgi:choline kinase
MNVPEFVILAAGLGSRLSQPHPKCLTSLITGETILERQLRLITSVSHKSVNVVVGYQKSEVVDAGIRYMPREPDLFFVDNPAFAHTNTSKSLLMALEAASGKGGVLWMNGDVVFDENLLTALESSLTRSTIVTTTSRVADEEIKYTLNPTTGNIQDLSKKVPAEVAVGEAVGINYVHQNDIPAFLDALARVDDQDYFEKAIELTIVEDQISWVPFNLTDSNLTAVEVDFLTDLDSANDSLR